MGEEVIEITDIELPATTPPDDMEVHCCGPRTTRPKSRCDEAVCVKEAEFPRTLPTN